MIFVDTSFWFALRRSSDRHHLAAVDLLRRVAGLSLLTTNHVRGEAWTLVRRRSGHASAVDLLDLLSASPRLTVLDVAPDLERSALEWLRRRDEREYSFVDATSFAVMRDLGVTEALAFDGDFAAAGFTELR